MMLLSLFLMGCPLNGIDLKGTDTGSYYHEDDPVPALESGWDDTEDPSDSQETGDSTPVDTEDSHGDSEETGDSPADSDTSTDTSVDTSDTGSGCVPTDEVCNFLDDDCDGEVDNGLVVTLYADKDRDGYGDSMDTARACELEGFVTKDGDCDDTNAAVNPDAHETCATEYDDNCDDTDDDLAPDATSWYPDNDFDGYGAMGAVQMRCVAPEGYVADGTDCDDGRSYVYPGATEVCDEVDDDCDGLIDDEDGLTCTSGVDADGDGVDAAVDCDDTDSEVGEALTFYYDADGDGFGAASRSSISCWQVTGYVRDNTDCDDTSADVFPGQVETCNSIDDNCDGNIDEDLSCAVDTAAIPDTGDTSVVDTDTSDTGNVPVDTSVVDTDTGTTGGTDADGDGYSSDVDCDDGDSGVNPGAVELDTVADEDCDGNPLRDASLTTLSGAVVMIVDADNSIDDESATFATGTIGSWAIAYDRKGTNVLSDLGPYADTWSATGGLAGGTYDGLALFPGDVSWAECDEEIEVSASVTVSLQYVIVFTVRNTGAGNNTIGVYADGAWLGTAKIAPGGEELVVAEFTAAASTATISLCTGTVQGGVDATQLGVFEAL